jgi:hypothetical protein
MSSFCVKHGLHTLLLAQSCDKFGALARAHLFLGLRAYFLAKFKYSCALPSGFTQLPKGHKFTPDTTHQSAHLG